MWAKSFQEHEQLVKRRKRWITTKIHDKRKAHDAFVYFIIAHLWYLELFLEKNTHRVGVTHKRKEIYKMCIFFLFMCDFAFSASILHSFQINQSLCFWMKDSLFGATWINSSQSHKLQATTHIWLWFINSTSNANLPKANSEKLFHRFICLCSTFIYVVQ